MIKIDGLYYQVYDMGRGLPRIFAICNVEGKPRQLPLMITPKTGRKSILQAKALTIAEWLNKKHTNNILIKQLFRYEYEFINSKDKVEKSAIDKQMERIWQKIEKQFKKEGKEYLAKADQQEGIQSRDTNACAVMAVLKLTNGKQTYDEMYNVFKKHGRVFQRGTPIYVTLNVLKEFGKRVVRAEWFMRSWRFEERTESSKEFPSAFGTIGYEFPIRMYHPGVQKVMPHRAEKKHVDKSKRYLGQTQKHIFAICNGIIDDWARDSKLPIKMIYEIK